MFPLSTLLKFTIIILLFQCIYSKFCKENPPSTYLCTLQDGKKIDISPLGLTDGKNARFSYDSEEYRYNYNPRYAFTFEKSTCENAAACQTKLDDKGKPTTTRYLLAKQEVDSWDSCTVKDTNTHAVCITYKEQEDAQSAKRQIIVQLVCSNDNKDVFTATQDSDFDNEDKSTYHMIVKSKHSCPMSSGLSVGSVLCILFTVLLFVYLVGGILFNHFARGATGKELIPNSQFWSGFPGLVKDGVLFSIKPCRKESDYDAI